MPRTISNEARWILRATRHLGRVIRGAVLASLFALGCMATTPASAATNFIDNGDGTVTDQNTALIWKRCAEGQTWTGSTCSGTPTAYTWSQASVLTSTFAGSSAWRTPSVSDLQTIVDMTAFNPTINATAFPNAPNAPNAIFWSSTEDVVNPNNGHYVNFIYGNTSALNKIKAFYVRMVRGTAATTGGGGSGGGAGNVTITSSIESGWNLLGNSLDQAIAVATLFGDANVINSVWKWDPATLTWQFYAPSLSAANLLAYANARGYAVLSTINAGEGYWVNAKSKTTISEQTGTRYALTANNLATGWNLVATGDDVTPVEFNRKLSVTPPTPGVTPNNFTTLWAWNNLASNWYFYAPSLDAAGTLTDYITSKGYLDFTQHNKTLGNGTGFWVNISAAAVAIQSSVSLALTDIAGTPLTTLPVGGSAIVTATVTDATGAAVSDAVVTFTTDPTIGSIAPTTWLTNAAGVAAVTISHAGKAGAGTILASAPVGGVTVSGSKGYTAAADTTAASITVALTDSAGTPVTTLSVNAPVTVTATAKTSTGVAVAGAIVSFSTDVNVGTITPDSALTDAAGVATVTINPAGTGASIITATTKVGTATVTGSRGYTAAAIGVAVALTKNGVAVTNVDSAGVDLTATVKDTTGAAVANTIVSFTTDAAVGTITPASALTDANGVAAVRLNPAGNAGAGTVIATTRVGTTNVTGSKTYTSIAVGTLQLLASSPQIASAGANTLDLTAIVLSATKQAVSGRTVTFSTSSAKGTDETAFVNNISTGGVSDANGIVTAKLNLGGLRENRTIRVTAVAASDTKSSDIEVTGTAITVSGTTSLAFNAEADLSFSVKDSAGTPLPNTTITVTSAIGNTITLTPATGITGNGGTVTARIKAVVPANDVITVTAAGATLVQNLTVSSASFTLRLDPTAPATIYTGIDIPLGPVGAPVQVIWEEGGVPQPGKTVNFAVSRGTITSTATTDATGTTGPVTVSSTSSGTAIITAAGSNGTPAAGITVNFVAKTADTVTVQAVPGTIQVTNESGSQTGNLAQISVLVRDAANNLVKNAGVNFTVIADPSAGFLSSARAVTDANGKASVDYTAGRTSSPSNGVIIQATVTDISDVALPVPVTGTTSLTVAGQSLLVRLGTDNVISGLTPTVYTKLYAAVVTDAAGNAVVGNTVRFALRPGKYYKGYWTYSFVTLDWQATVTTPAGCNNEDVNFNGILEAGEDNNGNLSLDPGNVATVTATGITDATGVARATITYPKDHAYWTQQILEARTGVVGNDPPASVSFILPRDGKDYGDPLVGPPGQVSPYGVGISCNDTN